MKDSDNGRKNKPSGKKADEEIIFNKFCRFLINNIRRERDEEEIFVGFAGFMEGMEESEVENKLRIIINNIDNWKGDLYYSNLINFHLLFLNNRKVFKKKK